MRFKPIYAAAAQNNTNKKIVFCSIETDKVRDCASANKISGIPHF